MSIEIRETIVTPMENGYGVQLRISDVTSEDESAAFVLRLSVQIPKTATDQLFLIEREALAAGNRVLRDLIDARKTT